MTEIEELLIELVKIPSVSGQEKKVGDFIISQLADIKGLKIQKQKVSKDRFNLVVKKGKSKKWLVAHMDTVPGNLPCRITKDKIFGRGACDNKQSIAASIILARQLENINILFTVGEEVDFSGAQKAFEKRTCGDAELVVVQEPTCFKIITGQCGVIAFSIETTGREQHSSLDKPNNAIHKLSEVLSTLIKKNWAAFNIGIIGGGIAENVVAGSARAMISVRPRDAKEQKEIMFELKRLPAKVVINKNIPSFRCNLGYPEAIATHFSEMGFFKNSIQFGAGDIRNAHTQQEYILRKDLNILPKKLLEILSRH
ncbi:MAG: M20/M25/M40 family metallo-hydrolase [Patescibacteria group bacterium]